MKFHLETINQFETILNSLDSNNNNLIRALSLFAEEYKENDVVASAFVNLIITKIDKTPSSLKINFLYLIDYIINNVGYLYTDLIANQINHIFIHSLLSITDTNEKRKYYGLRKSWQVCFSNIILEKLDNELNKIEPNWLEECLVSINDSENNFNNNQTDSLKSLPIISSKLKSENYVFYKNASYKCNTTDSFSSLHLDSNKENEFSESPLPIVPLWEVNIPDYPLFPEIGTDPRLLRRWYSTEKSQNIVIGNKNYELLLNRIQPCIFIDGMLHAVRFYCKRLQLKVNENIFEISITGASSIKIRNQSFYVCLGGPGHELVIVGIAYHIPIDGNVHRIWFNNRTVAMEWIPQDQVRVNIMPEIPSHISEWGWRGMFGSPKYLTSRPLNPMKPLESWSYRKQKKVLEIYNYNNKIGPQVTTPIVPQSWKEQQKKPEDQAIMKRKNDFKSDDNKSHKQCHLTASNKSLSPRLGVQEIGSVIPQFDKDTNVRFPISRHQIFNLEAVCQLFSVKSCSMCHKLFQYGDQIDFNSHLIEHHHNAERCYELLNDWIFSASSAYTNKPKHEHDILV